MQHNRRERCGGLLPVNQPSFAANQAKLLGSAIGPKAGESCLRALAPRLLAIGEVIRKLHQPGLHRIDWAVQSELRLWLRRKHQCSWRSARKHWNYQFQYKRCRLYQMVEG